MPLLCVWYTCVNKDVCVCINYQSLISSFNGRLRANNRSNDIIAVSSYNPAPDNCMHSEIVLCNLTHVHVLHVYVSPTTSVPSPVKTNCAFVLYSSVKEIFKRNESALTSTKLSPYSMKLSTVIFSLSPSISLITTVFVQLPISCIDPFASVVNGCFGHDKGFLNKI